MPRPVTLVRQLYQLGSGSQRPRPVNMAPIHRASVRAQATTAHAMHSARTFDAGANDALVPLAFMSLTAVLVYQNDTNIKLLHRVAEQDSALFHLQAAAKARALNDEAAQLMAF